jgi:hypothetical protein
VNVTGTGPRNGTWAVVRHHGSAADTHSATAATTNASEQQASNRPAPPGRDVPVGLSASPSGRLTT